MTIFTWGDNAAIRKMEIRPYGKKGTEAVLYADSDTVRGELGQIADQLRSLGWSVVPDSENGQHVVHLRGFQQPEEVIKALQQSSSISGEYRMQESPPRPKPKLKPMDKIRRVSLVAAGYAFGLGDLTLMAVGKLRNNASGNSEFLSGLAFSSSSVMLMRYGKKHPEKSFKDLHDRMLGQFVSEGVEIPGAKYLDLEKLGKTNGIVSWADRFLYEHPAEVNCAVNAYAGYRMADAGMKMRKDDPRAGTYKAMAGTLVGSGNIISLLVPEKPRQKLSEEARKERNEGVTGALLRPVRFVKEWIQEKPMRATGYMALVNNGFQFASALTERKNSREATGKSRYFWMFNLAAALSYTTGNALLAISPKDVNANTNGEEQDTFADIYASAASIIMRQPKERQELLVNQMAFYLAAQPEIRKTTNEVMQIVQSKLSAVKDSPWIDVIPPQQDITEPESAAPIYETANIAPSRWREREARSQSQGNAWTDKENARETESEGAHLSGPARY